MIDSIKSYYINPMKKSFIILSTLLHLSAGAIYAKAEPFLLGKEKDSLIFVNNRILAQVNGKSISVIDVMKKMDLTFYKQYPQYTSSVAARYQFYQMQWKNVLSELVDKELILADAEELKVTIPGGDVRQEMERLFGPNIVLNLDKVNLTFDEAWKMVEEELILRKMLGYRVHSKALRKVTPQFVKSVYEEFSKTNIRPEQWVYTVISIRNNDPVLGAEAANYTYNLLVNEGTPANDLPEKIKAVGQFKDDIKVSVSETLRHGEQDLSPAYKEVLLSLSPDAYSKPSAQKSRTDKSTVFRIFHLQAHTLAGPVPFSEIENSLRGQLLDDASGKETEIYIKKLRAHYHVEDSHFEAMTSDEFAPFVLK
jgi:hypothetical protein